MADIIEMPKLSDTMTTGTLVKWLKNEGDKVESGMMLAEVETDKATMELESFFDGTLLKIFAPAGSSVDIGAPLCAIGEPGEEVSAPETKAAEEPKKEEKKEETSESAKQQEAPPAAESKSAAKTETKSEAKPAPAATESAPASGDRIKISPLARKLAAEKKLDPSRIKGSGPGGRIVRADVLAAEAAGTANGSTKGAAAKAPSGPSLFAKGPIQEERSVPVSNMRGVIAKRLLESTTTIPYFYLSIDVDAGPVMALRAQLNEGLAGDGVKLSVNDFVLKASAEALRRVPTVNSSWAGSEIKYHGAAHVSFAVAIEDGLITPVIRDAQDKSIFDVSKEAKTLGKAARDKKLQPAQYTGGTFCVSNLGMMGITNFLAIINPPNSAILAVGTTVEKPVVKNGQIVIGQVMTLSLSVDHRVIDGAVGASFLGALRDLLEKPALLLV